MIHRSILYLPGKSARMIPMMIVIMPCPGIKNIIIPPMIKITPSIFFTKSNINLMIGG